MNNGDGDRLPPIPPFEAVLLLGTARALGHSGHSYSASEKDNYLESWVLAATR